MHMSPGLPIMKSADLVNWSLVGYAYDTLVDNADMRLEAPHSAYGAGSWASSLRFHRGIYYATTFSSTSGRTHIYTTPDIEKGAWTEHSFAPALHDHSLFFDDDGRVYMVYGAGDIRLAELKADLTGLRPDGCNDVIIRDASLVAGAGVGLAAEGSQVFAHGGKYYVVNITWPRGGMRTAIIHRADKITGPYEGRVMLADRGIAQGGLIETAGGEWYAYLFKDNGAVGRIPYLAPVRWVDGWPVPGEDGKVPGTLDIPAGLQGVSGVSGVVASDEFDRASGERALPLAWQWNHNPDNAHWSLGARPGHLRLSSGRVDEHLLAARNTLTQRTFGPRSVATTKLDVSGLGDGDHAGLAVLQHRYGYIAVKQTGGERHLVMVSADTDDRVVEVASVPLAADVVYLRAECEFEKSPELARFSYSLDGLEWTPLGCPSRMTYTLPHFMGYRFGLFYYATQAAGGHADFDFYHVSNSAK